MKRQFLYLFSILLLLASVSFSCKKSVNGVTLTPGVLNLMIGETATLTVTFTPENATNKNVIWKSSNSKVASVDGGVVTAIAKGKATITVTTDDGGHIDKCYVTIEPVTGIKLSEKLLRVAIGVTVTLTATITPENASNQTLIWESSNTNVAVVDNGKVTAKTEGKAIISVTTKDGNYTAKCEVIAPLIEPEMVFVESGTFTMGCTDEDCQETSVLYMNDFPAHQVTLTRSFSISKYQVTQKLWTDVMGDNPSCFKGDDLPVHQVSWKKVQIFIQRLNAATGKRYRLPTEAEWEYAARGGNKSMGYKYSGSNNLDEVAWHEDNSNNKIHPVGLKKPNELGIYDMSGNVWEWCFDGLRWYRDELQTNPVGPIDSTAARVVRGSDGCFYYPVGYKKYCRVSSRTARHPEHDGLTPYGWSLGFRLVLSQ